MSDIRTVLRGLPVLTGCGKSDFNSDDTPDHPVDLFLHWLHEAIDDGSVEPHLMTLTTVDTEGKPDARALILKDIDHQGWYLLSAVTVQKVKRSFRTRMCRYYFIGHRFVVKSEYRAKQLR